MVRPASIVVVHPWAVSPNVDLKTAAIPHNGHIRSGVSSREKTPENRSLLAVGSGDYTFSAALKIELRNGTGPAGSVRPAEGYGDWLSIGEDVQTISPGSVDEDDAFRFCLASRSSTAFRARLVR